MNASIQRVSNALRRQFLDAQAARDATGLGAVADKVVGSVAGLSKPVELCRAVGERVSSLASTPWVESDVTRRVAGVESPEKLFAQAQSWLAAIKANAGGDGVPLRFVCHLPSATATASHAAAVEGFVRTLAKEAGRFGATANLVISDEATEPAPTFAERFLLSPHSAFISGQVVQCTSTGEAQTTTTTRSAVVTGAAQGIGRSVALQLVLEGITELVVVDHPSQAEALATLAQEIGDAATVVECAVDLSDEGAVEEIARVTKSHLEGARVDVLVNNAGIVIDRLCAKMTSDEFRRVVHLDYDVPRALTDCLTGTGLLQRGSRAVHMSSIVGLAGNAGQINYSFAKAGLTGYAREEVHLRQHGVVHNCIAPGFIETQMTQSVAKVPREMARRASALQQGGFPVDIASAVAFLADPRARMVGQTLRVCGSNMIGR